ncbi:MAG: hypothetical protein IMZ44_12090 [Planctomycetes bacterium]|nr:hypothetical protein [Planctomycetota bacterium]
MTLEWIPLEQLQPHPENSNRMPPRLLEKLKRHIQRTGLYEPLVVRPLPGTGETAAPAMPLAPGEYTGGGAAADAHPREGPPYIHGGLSEIPASRYQILNGHHRAEVLRQLGHTHARCDVWLVGDDDARLLLATLNRLEGRDDPGARARLVAHLAEGRPAADLARLLPEPPDAVERLLKLSAPPPAPLSPEAAAPVLRPMTFFLTEAQHALVLEALSEIRAASDPLTSPRREAGGDGAHVARLHGNPLLTQGASNGVSRQVSAPRAECLQRLALWYLEARNLR